ncbi:C40 family peptidase [Ornithinibacillus contaminans]|uniref:C40 family peptidase n=1 Tax=Ornithinibacillus contaminans TaxID=694055 RepID=UPI00069D9A4D|nr:NlpC/P60 family protein [Ornithinibacillus contaminans]
MFPQNFFSFSDTFYVVSVQVATMWTTPGKVTNLDLPAIANPTNLEEWTKLLTYEQKLALCNDNRVQTQALYGEPVLVKEIQGEWAKVTIPNQPSHKDVTGYPGWIPLRQLKKVTKQDWVRPETAAVTATHAWLETETGEKIIRLSYMTCLPCIATNNRGDSDTNKISNNVSKTTSQIFSETNTVSTRESSSEARNIATSEANTITTSETTHKSTKNPTSKTTDKRTKNTDKNRIKVYTPHGTLYLPTDAITIFPTDTGCNPKDGSAIIEAGKQFLGLEYLWGGMSSFGYDCSGFSYAMHKAAGYQISRDASDQAEHGKEIALDELLPGDLLFFAYQEGVGSIHHVGIYFGDGKMIHSPQTGKGIEITSLKDTIYEKELCVARRYWRG